MAGAEGNCALARRRASQRQAGARRACLSTGMCEFAPARLAREAQGSFGNTMLPKPSCRALGFGYFPRKESNPLAAEASGTFARALHREMTEPSPGATRHPLPEGEG